MREHHEIEADQAVIDPKMIVIHWTETTTFEDAFNVFDPSELHGRPDIEGASNLNVSVPFLIDRNGLIHQLMPETRFGRHVIGLNYCAIGIENVGNGGSHPLTRKQLKSNVRLIRYLMTKYSVEYVIGHHEYLNFKDHKLYRESDPYYFTVKTDPGDPFMKKLFRRLGLDDSYRKPH